MHKLSQTEENYLKTIYKYTADNLQVGTTALSADLKISPASVTDMLKRLFKNGFLEYQPYRGVTLTALGKQTALTTIRRHRLWEVFLVNVLELPWKHAHDTAERLGYIDDELLIARLDNLLGYPQYDPLGEPIPNINGEVEQLNTTLLSQISINQEVKISGITQRDPNLLKYLNRLQLNIGMKIKIAEIIPFDNSRLIKIEDKTETVVSSTVAELVLVIPT